MTEQPIQPATPLTRRFVRLLSGFTVGVAVGLAPFLGVVNVPGFKALLSVMPFQIVPTLIPLSAFLMGIIVVAVQFYVAERISRSVLRRRFALALVAMVVGFFLFVVLRSEFTVEVERGESLVTVLISSSPLPDCYCKDPEEKECCEDPKEKPEACIRILSFNRAAIESCWGRTAVRRRGQLLGLSYLLLTGGLGVLVGLLLVRDERIEQAANQQLRRRKPAGKPTASEPTTADSAIDPGAKPTPPE